jgi:hypothetical protein
MRKKEKQNMTKKKKNVWNSIIDNISDIRYWMYYGMFYARDNYSTNSVKFKSKKENK